MTVGFLKSRIGSKSKVLDRMLNSFILLYCSAMALQISKLEITHAQGLESFEFADSLIQTRGQSLNDFLAFAYYKWAKLNEIRPIADTVEIVPEPRCPSKALLRGFVRYDYRGNLTYDCSFCARIRTSGLVEVDLDTGECVQF